MISYDNRRDCWKVAVSVSTISGKKRRLWKTAKTKNEAKQIEAKLLMENKGYSDGLGVTMDTAFESFYEHVKENRRKATADFYLRFYQKDVSPYIGKTKLKAITVLLLSQWKKMIGERQTENITKNHSYMALHVLFKYCDRVHGTKLTEMLNQVGNFRDNPNKVDLRSEEQKKEDEAIHYWTFEQFSKVSAYFKEKAMAVKETSYNYLSAWCIYLFLNTLFYAGLRRSEANALLIQDFHEKGGRCWLSISKTVPKGKDGTDWTFAPTKNKASIRDVPIPNALAKELKDHIENRLKRLPDYSEKTFLFGGSKPLPEATFDMAKNRAEKAVGVPHIRVHDLRHSYATFLLNKNVPLTVISRLLGHSSTNITWQIYAHVMPETMSDAIDVFDKIEAK